MCTLVAIWEVDLVIYLELPGREREIKKKILRRKLREVIPNLDLSEVREENSKSST